MNFLVTMSSGTTQVINATLAGCIDDGIRQFYPDAEIFIPKPGIIGLLEDNIYKVRWDVNTKDLAKLPGSSITGTFIELGQRERALAEVQDAKKSRLITLTQVRQLNAIVDKFLPILAREEAV
jgi:6-phosphofructokinase